MDTQLEYLTLKRNALQLEEAVQSDLVTITGKLRSKGLISEKIEARLNDESRNTKDRAAKLVTIVTNMVKLKPEQYNVFVEVLQELGIDVIRPRIMTQDNPQIMSTLERSRGRGEGGGGAPRPRSASLMVRSSNTMAEERVLIEGYLHKLGRTFKGWHKRYFRIKGLHMYYYKRVIDKCLGEIDLSNCHYCEPASVATFGAAFEIRTTQRSHILAAQSKEEMQKWINTIKQNVALSESAYTKLSEQLSEQVTARKKSGSMISKVQKRSKRLSFTGSPDVDIYTDTHRECFQVLSEVDDSQPPLSSSMSEEPLTELGVSVNRRPSTAPAKRPFTPSRPPPPQQKLDRAKRASVIGITNERSLDNGSHNGRYQESSEHDRSQAPISSSSSIRQAGVRLSMSAEPLTDVGISIDRIQTGSQPPVEKVDSVKRISVITVTNERGVDVSTVNVGKEHSVPTLLRGRRFQWENVRMFLDTAKDSVDKDLHDELPPQETPWMNESSPIEQLRMFLELNPLTSKLLYD